MGMPFEQGYSASLDQQGSLLSPAVLEGLFLPEAAGRASPLWLTQTSPRAEEHRNTPAPTSGSVASQGPSSHQGC